MSRSDLDEGRRSGPLTAALLIGLPLAAVVLGLIHFGPLRNTPAYRYVEHPVEWVEVVLFCCALGALGGKFARWRGEMEACHTPLLPRWDGKPVPTDEAPNLLSALDKLPGALPDTLVGRRFRAILNFVCQRRSTADLDDHLRTLGDNDALAVENSYSLVRFITWAIPILGFLGTVLGITQAIAGVTPEVLEESMSQVTDGLATAFDCTALALGLTMLLMLASSLVERLDGGALEAVDHQVEQHLAHRFARADATLGPVVEALRQQTAAISTALEQLVSKQAQLWADALSAPERRATELLDTTMRRALEATLQGHATRLSSLEQHTAGAVERLMQHLGGLAVTVRETSREQQAALVRVAEGIAAQATVLGRLQENEGNLVHLQAVLHQNLAAIASASDFEQAVHSLTAAVHLLTARAAPRPQAA